MKNTFLACRLPVWPFHALGLVAVVLGGTFVVGWWPSHYPAESELVKLAGEVDQIVVRDDISGTTAGAILPGWTSTYFTLSGVEGEFRYPRTHPKSLRVRDQTSGTLEVWVERTAIGSEEPMIIWQIQEHNPYKKDLQDTLGEETFVSRAEIVERLKRVDRSMVGTGVWLLGLGIASILFGIGAKRWNQRFLSQRN